MYSPRQLESGSTLLVVVLITTIMLAGLLLVTSNLALSTNRTTKEQKAIIPAQLAAESGISLAKSKLDIAYEILRHTKVPDNTISLGEAEQALAQLCPGNVQVLHPNYLSTNGPVVLNGTSVTVNEAVKICDYPSGSQFSLDQAKIFALSTPDPNDPTQNLYKKYGLSFTEAAKKQLYRDLFSPDEYITIDNTKLKSGLRALSLLQTGKYQYRLYFKVAGIDSVGNVENAQRRISVASNESIGMIQFSFEANKPRPPPVITPPPPPTDEVNFSEFGYFANTYNNFDGAFTGAYRFTGRMHSNMPLAFANASPMISRGVYASAQIGGPLTTSSCDRINTVRQPNGDRIDTCYSGIRGPGFYAGRDRFVSAKKMNIVRKDLTFTSYSGHKGVYDVYNTLSPNTPNVMAQPLGLNLLVEKGQPAPDLAADFIRFPINDTSQKAAANTHGIFLNNPLRVELSVDGMGDSAIQKIKITERSNKTYTLSYGKDKIMYIDTGSGRQRARKTSGDSPGWVADPTANDYFGGVLYANGEITSLTGPQRRNSSDPNSAGPAIAKFSNINIVASKDINLTGDLKYEVRCTEKSPCIDAHGNRTADNMLGIYSVGAHVNTMLMKGTDQQITVSSPGNPLRLNAPANLQLDAFIMAGGGGFAPRYVDHNGTEYKSAGGRHLAAAKCNCKHGMTVIRGGLIVDRSINTGYTRSSANFGSPPVAQGGFDFYIEYDKRGNKYSPIHFPTGKGKPDKTGSTPTPPPAPPVPVTPPVTGNSKLTKWQVIFTKVDPQTGKMIEENNLPVKPDFSLDKEIIQNTISGDSN